MRNLKKTLLAFLIATVAFLYAIPQESYAVPAYSGVIKVPQPDGTSLSIRIFGDEFFSYTTTESGYLIERKNDGFYYYSDYSSGALLVSDIKASSGRAGFSRNVPESVVRYQTEIGMRLFPKSSISNAVTRSGGTKTILGGFQPERVLVLLVEYPDYKSPNDSKFTANFKELITRQFNAPDYYENGNTGSSRQYFIDNSNGAYTPYFDIAGPFLLPQSVEYYGQNQGRGSEAIQQFPDALRAADAAGFDFSKYDYNNDGILDPILIVYAGGNPAEGRTKPAVWPHKSSLLDQSRPINVVVDGLRADVYACTSELRGSSGTNTSGIGTLTHEFSHVLGLPDLYKTDGSGDTPGLWCTLSVMHKGGYNNEGRTPPNLLAFERYFCGWLTMKEIKDSGTYTLKDIANYNEAYMIPTLNEDEVYVLETLIPEGWDKYINNELYPYGNGILATPDMKGMLITHIDRSKNIVGGLTAYNRWHNDNSPNNIISHQCYDLVEACAHEDLTKPVTGVFFPGSKNVRSWNANTVPNNKAWDGSRTSVDLSNITMNGNVITFDAAYTPINANQAHIVGSVTGFRTFPLANAVVKFYDASAKTTSSGLFTATSFTKANTKAAAQYEVTTDNKGQYELLNLEAKNYIIEVEYDGYIKYSIPKVLPAGISTTLDIKLNPDSSNPALGFLSWHKDDMTNKVTYSGKALYLAVDFQVSDMSLQPSNKIEYVQIAAAGNYEHELFIYKGNASTLIANKKVSSSVAGEFVKFDLSGDDVNKTNNEKIRIVVKITSPTNSVNFYLDKTVPTINGKSNLFSEGGANFVSLKDSKSMDGSNLITAALAKSSVTDPKVVNLTAYPSQTEAELVWETTPSGPTSWKIKWKKATESTFQTQTVTKQSLILKNLAESQKYDVEVGAIVTAGTEPVSYTKIQFTTGGANAPYPGISIPKSEYKVGDALSLSLRNLQGTAQSVVYKVNGTAVTGDSYTFTTAGAQVITVEITYAPGDVETITRKLTIKAN